MALYAQSRTDWSPRTKALIYGAYMHVIQDHFAGMVLQPTRFGYGYAVEAETVRHDPILSFPELFYEALFTPTYIPNWRFVSRDLYRALYTAGGNFHFHNFGGSCDFMPLHDYVDFHYQTGWQDEYLPAFQELILVPLARFILAADVNNYANSSLTVDRLCAYMHAWAVFFFLTNGYWANISSTPPYEGGIYAHTNWTPDSIINFWSGIIGREVESIDSVFLRDNQGRLREANYLLRDPFYGPLIRGVIHAILTNIADHAFHKTLRKTLREKVLPYALDNVEGQLPWPDYFQDWRNFNRLSDSIKNLPVFAKIGEEIAHWSRWSQIKEPNLRSSYSEEVSTASHPFGELYKAYLHQGIGYLDSLKIDFWTISRKAGLTGGMYELPSENYGRQSGILFMGFKKGRDTVWSNINLYRNGDPQYVKLVYDLIYFAPTKVVVKGKTSSGGIMSFWKGVRPIIGAGRWKDSISINGTEWANANVCTLWFEVEVASNTDDYRTMFSSKYNDVYTSSRPEIYNNLLYKKLFKDGDPTREAHENPFLRPDTFWPYALRTTPIDGWYLNQPTNLTANPTNTNRIQLRWYDNSGYEVWFDIRRENLETGDVVWLGTSGNGQTRDWVVWEDDSITLGYRYKYTVRSFRDGFYSEPSNSTIALTQT